MGPAAAAPAYLQVFTTLRCDRACGFCFNRGLSARADLEVADLAEILDRVAGAGTASVDLLGGEPTLHEGLGELVAAVARRGLRATLSTNGAGRLDLLERLEEEFGRATLRIGVSVNGEAVSPALAGYLRRRAPMVKSVCERGRALPGALVEHLGRPGAEGYLIFMDALGPDDLGRTLSYQGFSERLGGLQRRHPNLAGVVCGGFLPDLEASPALDGVRCPAGTTKLSVLPDGSVFPCYLLFGRPEFSLGNLARDPFDRIWNHPALEFFRSFRGNPCARVSCRHHASCRGGCPAVSLRVAGDLSAPDPRCSQ